MPTTQHNPKTAHARRFAALMAGCDLGNASEEEALGKFRALRRMAADSGLRIVDVLELPDVKQAIDDQMQPRRQESAALQKAMEQADALREELTARTRDVRKLAELLAQARNTKAGRVAPSRKQGNATRSAGTQAVSDLATLIVVLVLMYLSSFIKGCN
jgi:predicted  nucleic acid-binding Zn-ribbon protein